VAQGERGYQQLTFPSCRDGILIMDAKDRFQIAPVRTAEDLAAVVVLFRAYATSLDIDLSYQNFDMEIASMPGKYAPPTGELLLARSPQGKPIGCAGLRPLERRELRDEAPLCLARGARYRAW
jgi:hypothetical protein